ncbi:MAG: bifunctional adenosylcobinamide kinase/adenosylcobinamide-phosphate guanylyltransferase [Faecousia sp.]
MILIIGGAYQGKLDFAKSAFSLSEEDVFSCTGEEIDFSKRCIDRIEEFTWDCVRKGMEPKDFFQANREKWRRSILICQDIFCGVVPMDPVQREWRQATGRLCQYLAGEASQVSRILCGLEQRLK